jgi:hypothetical protein
MSATYNIEKLIAEGVQPFLDLSPEKFAEVTARLLREHRWPPRARGWLRRGPRGLWHAGPTLERGTGSPPRDL